VTSIRGRLLDLSYELAVEDELLAAHLLDVYIDSLDDAVEDVERFALSRSGAGGFTITRDGEKIASASTADRALGLLHWHLNRRTVATSRQAVLVHAGTVECAGRGVLAVGASGAGKTTATASLAMAGLGYLTDDITAVQPDGRVIGAAKPIGLRAPSIDVLGLARLHLQAPPAAYLPQGEAQRFVAASSLGAPVAASADPGMIIFLSSELPAGTAAELRRSPSLARLTEYAFDLDGGNGRGFPALAELVRNSTCWEWGRSTAGDLLEFVRSALPT
jgi:hypothetical protein